MLIKYSLILSAILLNTAHAVTPPTITAVTTNLGTMTSVTVTTPINKALYSDCISFTPYTYQWRVNDLVSVQGNDNASAWTLNDLSTAAVGFCIHQTIL